jgi:hypothetical protein
LFFAIGSLEKIYVSSVSPAKPWSPSSLFMIVARRQS